MAGDAERKGGGILGCLLAEHGAKRGAQSHHPEITIPRSPQKGIASETNLCQKKFTPLLSRTLPGEGLRRKDSRGVAVRTALRSRKDHGDKESLNVSDP